MISPRRLRFMAFAALLAAIAGVLGEPIRRGEQFYKREKLQDKERLLQASMAEREATLKGPNVPPRPAVPPNGKPFGRPPPPPPPQVLDLLPEDLDEFEEMDGTDEGLYSHDLWEGDIVPPIGILCLTALPVCALEASLIQSSSFSCTSPSHSTPSLRKGKRNAVADPQLKWPSGAVIYKVHDSVGCPSSPQCRILMKAMRHYHKSTCIRFKEWTGEPNSVNVFLNSNSGACYSSVGRTSVEVQDLSLGERCWYLGIVIHELAHSVGFWHEMNRPDRDDWIWVYWENIIPGFQTAFSKNSPSTVNELGEHFDYKSIMMYDEYAFSKDGVSATLQAKQEGTVIGPIWKKKDLSESDLRRIEKLYYCKGSNPLPGFPNDIYCDFNQHQCGFKNGGSATWNWRSVDATEGYIYADWEESKSSSGYLQSINFHPLDVASNGVKKEALGCLRFWYYIDGDATAELMVWHAYLDYVTQLTYDPDKVFQLWEDGNSKKSWMYVNIPLYVSRPFKLIFISNFGDETTTGTIAIDDVELLYSPCLEEDIDAETTIPESPQIPQNPESKPTSQPIPSYCPSDLKNYVQRTH